MLALSRVKKNIEFNHRFSSILEVLKSIAVAQFHALEHKLGTFEPFDRALGSFFDSIDTKTIAHPFLVPGNRPKAVVAITSDQGLLGGLNVRVASSAIGSMNTNRDQLIVIGAQGKAFARYGNVSFVSFPGVCDEERYQQALSLRDYLFQKVNEGQFASIQVVCARALSLVSQRIELITLLPLSREESQPKSNIEWTQMIFESSPESILEYLAFLWVGERLHQIFGMSRLAELGARYIHLEESTQRIQEMTKKLKLQYFRLRHEMIDQSMRELFAARSLYAA
ncbi:MAG: F0F1 ATP synthase subunit gamma [Candidatus Omnitrophica bacterium]|nr:F0F1 ATP synthase subunit gamma [Candidatus Omnitrophota bacterium]